MSPVHTIAHILGDKWLAEASVFLQRVGERRVKDPGYEIVVYVHNSVKG